MADWYVDVSLYDGAGGSGTSVGDKGDAPTILGADLPNDGDRILLYQSIPGVVDADCEYAPTAKNLTIESAESFVVEMTRALDPETNARSQGLTATSWQPQGSAWFQTLPAGVAEADVEAFLINLDRGDGREWAAVPKAADFTEVTTTANRWFPFLGNIYWNPDTGQPGPRDVWSTGFERMIIKTRNKSVLTLSECEEGYQQTGVRLSHSYASPNLNVSAVGQLIDGFRFDDCEMIDPWYTGTVGTRSILVTIGAVGGVNSFVMDGLVCQGPLIRIDDPNRTLNIEGFDIEDAVCLATWPTYADGTTVYPDLSGPSDRALMISAGSVLNPVLRADMRRVRMIGFSDSNQAHNIRGFELVQQGRPADWTNPDDYRVGIINCDLINMPGTYNDGPCRYRKCLFDLRANKYYGRTGFDMGVTADGNDAYLETTQIIATIGDVDSLWPISLGGISPTQRARFFAQHCDFIGEPNGVVDSGVKGIAHVQSTGNGEIECYGCSWNRTALTGRIADNFGPSSNLRFNRCLYGDNVDPTNMSDSTGAVTEAQWAANVDTSPDALFQQTATWTFNNTLRPNFLEPTGDNRTEHLDEYPEDGIVPQGRGINGAEYTGHYSAWQDPAGSPLTPGGAALPGRRRRRAAARRAARGGR